MDEAVDIRARLHGASQVRGEARGISDSVLRIGWAGHQAARGLGTVTGAARGFGNTITSWRSAAVVGTIGYAGKALAGVGLGFDARMEQNTVAFSQFLGSAQAAREEMQFLQKTAARTPFELSNITPAARRLLAYNFSLKETNGWIGTIGDTIAGVGGGAAEIDSLVRAIGQIKSKGRLQGDEMMQLSELGVLNRQRLAKDLGVTSTELMSGNANISGTKALRALRKQLDDTFGGQSARQAKTFNGQLSTLRDNLSQVLGKASMPVFDRLRKDVFPAAGRATDDFNKALDRHDLSMSDRINLGWARARHDLSPMAKGIERDLKAADLDDRFYDLIDWATPRMADAAGDVAPKVAGAFVTGWLHAGVWGKLITGAFLAKKLGAFGVAGDLAAGRFQRRFATGTAAREAEYALIGTRIGRWIGPAAATAAVGFIAYELEKRFGDAVGDILSAPSEGAAASDRDPSVRRGRRMMHDPAIRRGIRSWEHEHPVLARRVHRGHFDPRELAAAGYPGLIPGGPGVPKDYSVINVNIDGKTVARVVHKHADDAAARKRRR